MSDRAEYLREYARKYRESHPEKMAEYNRTQMESRRGLVKLVLPDMPKKTDVNRFAKEFGLEAPAGETYEFIRGILTRFGLGMFVKYLQKSYAYAKSQKRPLSWDVFTEVANGYADLAKENKNA